MRLFKVLLYVTAFILLAFVLAVVWKGFRHEQEEERSPAAPVAAPPVRQSAVQSGAESISPIAQALNASDGSIERDLQILEEVFVAWQTNFPREGNPVGENHEITAALTGGNRLRYAFVAPTHPAINTRRELSDRWGTPFRFHQLSGTRMEIISAGPDRRFATADDVQR